MNHEQQLRKAAEAQTPEQIALYFKNKKDWNVLELAGKIHKYAEIILNSKTLKDSEIENVKNKIDNNSVNSIYVVPITEAEIERMAEEYAHSFGGYPENENYQIRSQSFSDAMKHAQQRNGFTKEDLEAKAVLAASRKIDDECQQIF